MMGLAQSEAKIQRTFLGVSLGESRQRVMQVMSINGYRIEEKRGGFTAYSTVQAPGTSPSRRCSSSMASPTSKPSISSSSCTPCRPCSSSSSASTPG